MDLTQLLAIVRRAPEIVIAIRTAGIPVSVVSGALRLLADGLDALDKNTPKK